MMAGHHCTGSILFMYCAVEDDVKETSHLISVSSHYEGLDLLAQVLDDE